MSEKTELLPCPFCGDAMTINSAGMVVHVEQGECMIGTLGFPSEHGPSVTRWNTRPDPTVEQAARVLLDMLTPAQIFNASMSMVDHDGVPTAKLRAAIRALAGGKDHE